MATWQAMLGIVLKTGCRNQRCMCRLLGFRPLHSPPPNRGRPRTLMGLLPLDAWVRSAYGVKGGRGWGQSQAIEASGCPCTVFSLSALMSVMAHPERDQRSTFYVCRGVARYSDACRSGYFPVLAPFYLYI
jgi:hypothetical protein